MLPQEADGRLKVLVRRGRKKMLLSLTSGVEYELRGQNLHT